MFAILLEGGGIDDLIVKFKLEHTMQAGIYCNTSNFLKSPHDSSALAYLWQFLASEEKGRNIFLYCWLLQMRQLLFHCHSQRYSLGHSDHPPGSCRKKPLPSLIYALRITRMEQMKGFSPRFIQNGNSLT